MVVLGDGGVGKTSMVLRYCENAFKDNYIMTIGSNFSTKQVELEEYPNYLVKLIEKHLLKHSIDVLHIHDLYLSHLFLDGL